MLTEMRPRMNLESLNIPINSLSKHIDAIAQATSGKNGFEIEYDVNY